MQSRKGSKNMTTKSICIASGKGGVGKTTLSINIALSLAEEGKKILYFDADTGLANAQIGLGTESPLNLSHVVRGLTTLPEIVVETRYGIDLISGASGVEEMASLGKLETSRIIQSFSGLSKKYDYLIVDCAAGVSSSVLAFLHGSQIRVVVGTTELSSIADAYALIKIMVNDYNINQFIYLPNLVDSEKQGRSLYESMNEVVRKYLFSELSYLGSVVKDEATNSSWKKNTPMVKLYPSAVMSSNIRKISKELMSYPIPDHPGEGVQFFMESLE